MQKFALLPGDAKERAMNKGLCVAKCILALAALLTGICQAQIRPPVHDAHGSISIGPLHGLRRDQLMVVDLTVKKDGSVGDVGN
jgi:hypothetical protein